MKQTAVVIFHFVLKGIPRVGTLAHLVTEFLRGFIKDEKSLHFKEIIFNIPNEDALSRHADEMTALANDLAEWVPLPH